MFRSCISSPPPLHTRPARARTCARSLVLFHSPTLSLSLALALSLAHSRFLTLAHTLTFSLSLSLSLSPGKGEAIGSKTCYEDYVQECKDKKSKPKNMSGAELLYLRMKVCLNPKQLLKVCLNPKQLLYLGMKVCHCRLSVWGACLSFAHTHLVRVCTHTSGSCLSFARTPRTHTCRARTCAAP